MRVESKKKRGGASQPQLPPRWERGQVVLWCRCNLAWFSVTLPNLGFAQVTYPLVFWIGYLGFAQVTYPEDQWYQSTTRVVLG